MAFVIADRVRESSTTTGTGSIALGGAVTGYRTFGSVLTTADTTYYTIADQGGANWEVGIGTFTSPSTLARTTILSSSNGGSIVTFTAGTKDVFISLPASKTNTNDQPNVIAVNSTSDALRVTQTGTGNALVVEDSTNPDATPIVIDSTGRLNVGGTVWYNTGSVTPNTQFNGTGTNASLALNAWQAGTNVPARIYFNRADSNTVGDFSDPVDSGDNLGIIHWAGSDGSGFTEAATINAAADGATAVGDVPGRLIFSTRASGAGAVTERMRIDSAGQVGIGTSSITGYRLRIGGSITGATTSYGVSPDLVVSSDVTLIALGVHTNIGTQATAFTLSNLRHYSARQATIGAGSIVTNQYGYWADSTITGATNNYGFYSNIASGTGRWNFYANGTADNYFNGSVGVGTTTLGSKLTVNGDVAGTFFVNPTTVSANYTVPTNYNAMTAGPISVASGVVVTVPSGSTWVIA